MVATTAIDAAIATTATTLAFDNDNRAAIAVGLVKARAIYRRDVSSRKKHQVSCYWPTNCAIAAQKQRQ